MSTLEQTQADTVSLTPPAAEAIRGLMTSKNLGEDYALRVFVAGGSCSGLQYGMSLDNNIRPTDLITENNGVKVVVDEVSIQYLKGASVDYVESDTGPGFRIHNPNAVSCGCGSQSEADGESGCAGCSSSQSEDDDESCCAGCGSGH